MMCQHNVKAIQPFLYYYSSTKPVYSGLHMSNPIEQCGSDVPGEHFDLLLMCTDHAVNMVKQQSYSCLVVELFPKVEGLESFNQESE